MKTLIIGLGNPLLGDDGVGIEIVNSLKQNVQNTDIVVMNSSGFEVAEKMLEYDKVIVVDAIAGREPGSVHTFSLEDFKPTLHFTNPHDTNIQTAINLLSNCMEVPREVKFVVVEIMPENEFREGLSPAVKKAISKARKLVLKELKGGNPNGN